MSSSKQIVKASVFTILVLGALILAPLSYAQTVSPGGSCGTSSECIGGGSFSCYCGTCQPTSVTPPTCNNQTSYSVYTPTNSTAYHTDKVFKYTVGSMTEAVSLNSGGGTIVALNLLTQLYKTPPASGSYAIAMLQQDITGAKPAFAQGYGYTALSPIAGLWAMTRNIALGGFVIIVVVIGIMVILRNKIDPRTVISIQQALPKVVVSLLLVLFSYALVGFSIDLVQILTRIGLATMQNEGFIAVPPGGLSDAATNARMIDKMMNANIFELMQDLYNVDNIVQKLSSLDDKFNFLASALKIDAAAGGGITRLVLWIAVFISVIRTFFMLLTSYLSITLKLITAPFSFLFMAIPGSASSFGDWYRDFMSHLLVFPVVIFMLAFAAIFVTRTGTLTYYQNATGTGLWGVQNFAFNVTTPYWAAPGFGNWYDLVGPLLSLAIILTVPKAINITRELVHPKFRPSAAEGEVGKTLQSAAGRIPMLGSFTRA